MICRLLRHHGGRIAKENPSRSPVASSSLLLSTREALTLADPVEGGTFRGWLVAAADRRAATAIVSLIRQLGRAAVDVEDGNCASGCRMRYQETELRDWLTPGHCESRLIHVRPVIVYRRAGWEL